MPKVDSDHNLLFAVLALRTELVSREALLAAMNAWAVDRSRPLGEILVAQGALRPDRRGWIEAMVDTQVEGGVDLIATLPMPAGLMGSLASREQPPARGDDPRPTAAVDLGPALPTLTLAAPTGGSSDPTLGMDPSRDATLALARPRVPAAGGSRDAAFSPQNRFRVIRPHARGGLGQVFLAFDEELGREVALKEIQEHHADDPRSRARFVLEAEVTGGLEHPGVVPVYSLNRYENGRPYYAMRFIRGESLADVLERYHADPAKYTNPGQSRLDFRRLLRRFIDVCYAIAYAHSRGVLHRDIKPANIMLGKYGETLVVDWGLAKSVAQPDLSGFSTELKLTPSANSGTAETMPGSAIGTPQFMSPEQAEGNLDKIGPASDVYSLGATLYCLLTGHAAFENPDVGITLRLVQEGYFPAPRVHEPSLSPALEAICLKAMARLPEDRYATPKALAEDIEHWLADDPVSAHRESLAHRLARWSRRHRTWVQAGAAAIILIAIVSLVAAVRIQGEKRKESAARHRAETERRRAEGLGARLVLDRATDYFEGGNPGRAMLNLAYGLTLVPPEDTALDRGFRRNLAGWRQRLSPLERLLPHDDLVEAVAYRPDGRIVLTGSGLGGSARDSGQARLWDAQTGEPEGDPLPHPGTVHAVAFAPGGQRYATGCADGLVRIWDATTSRLVGSPLDHGEPVYAVAFDARGEIIASAGAGGIARLWRTTDGKPLGEIAPAVETDKPRAIRSLAFSPVASQLALGCGDGLARICDVQPIQERFVATRAHEGPITSVAFRSDGKVLLVGGTDGVVRMWDPAGIRLLGPRPIEHAVGVNAVAFSPDGRVIACGTDDNNVRLWLAETCEPYSLPLEHKGTVVAVAFSPGGKSLLTGGHDNAARIWSIPPPAAVHAYRGHDGPINAVDLRADAAAILTAGQDGRVLWRDLAGNALGRPLVHPGPIRAAAFSADGKRAVTGCDDGKARVWDLTAGRVIAECRGRGAPIAAVAFRRDGKAVLAGSLDGKAAIHNATTGQMIGVAFDHGRTISAVDFRGEGDVVLTAGGYVARLWDAARGSALPVEIRHAGLIYSARFRPDGQLVLTAGENNTAQLWETMSGQPVGTPMIHHASIIVAGFSPDGETILTGSLDRTARLWDAATGAAIGPPMRHSVRLASAAFGPHNRFVATGDAAGVVHLWDVPVAVAGTPQRLKIWCEVLTGLRLETGGRLEPHPSGVARALDAEGYRRRLQQLQALGGPPTP